MTLGATLWSRLGSPRAGAMVVLAGVLLTLPSVGNGIALDDRFHVAMVGRYAAIERAPWDLYRFISGEPAEMGRLIETGFLPWWSRPEARTAFFRPLSSLSVWVDYAVLPQWPWLFHLENLAVYAALVALVFALHRATLEEQKLAALAALLFAVDDGHGIAVGWLANRNALFATAFGLLALLAHRRAVLGSALHRILAPGAFAAALCFGESALAAFGYVLAWAWAIDERPLRQRLSSVLPFVLVLVGWAITVRSLGFGVRGSDFYVDPADAPFRFLRTFPSWFLAVTTSQFAGAPASDGLFVWTLLPWPAGAAAALIATAALAVIGRALWPLLQRERASRFYLLGSLFSLGLATATVPSDRNLLFAGVGAFGLIAQLVGSLDAPAPTQRSARWLRRWLIGTHLVLAPLLLPGMAAAPGVMDWFLKSATREALREPPQTLVVINATNIVMNAFYLSTPSHPGELRPRQLISLTPSMNAVTALREDEHSLRITLAPGWGREPTAGLTRDSDHPLRPGDAFSAAGARITVLETDARGRMQVIRARFEVPLEDASLRWLQWTGTTLSRWELPPLGETRGSM